METRVEPRAYWGKIGAIALPLGVIMLVAATAVHPSREDVMNHTAVFREYAQTDAWIGIHFTQWLASLVFFAFFDRRIEECHRAKFAFFAFFDEECYRTAP